MILASVRSTGTRFFTEIFRNAGIRCYKKEGITSLAASLSPGLHASHCEPVHMFHLEHRARDYPLFLPMRHPCKVAQSWIKRGWPINHLFFAEWYNLFWLHEQYNGHWLPIDTPDRDEYLYAAGKISGIDLKTDWKPYEVTETDFEPLGMTLKQTMKVLRVMPFEFYDLRNQP